jgi:hypothetical protein
MNTMLTFPYPYEEFAQHLDAMKQVQKWEDTALFGNLADRNPSSANSARIIEYFNDTYSDAKEAVHKSNCFMQIHDYIGKHLQFFKRKGLLWPGENGMNTIDRNLFRAVHFIFTEQKIPIKPDDINPRRVLILALAFKRIADGYKLFWIG